MIRILNLLQKPKTFLKLSKDDSCSTCVSWNWPEQIAAVSRPYRNFIQRRPRCHIHPISVHWQTDQVLSSALHKTKLTVIHTRLPSLNFLSVHRQRFCELRIKNHLFWKTWFYCICTNVGIKFLWKINKIVVHKFQCIHLCVVILRYIFRVFHFPSFSPNGQLFQTPSGGPQSLIRGQLDLSLYTRKDKTN